MAGWPVGGFAKLGDRFNNVAAGDPFPGTDLGGSVNAARDQVKSSLKSFSSRPAEMAEIAKGVGDKFEVEDADFANRLHAMAGLQ